VNRISSILGALAVVAIAVVFIVQFRPATNQQMTAGPQCAAEIRGSCLPAAQFWASYRLIGQSADSDQLRRMSLRKHVLEGLVDRVLLVEDAKRLGLSVSDEDVTRELANGRARVSLPSDQPELGFYFRLNDDAVRFLPVKNHTTKKFDPKQYEKIVRQVSKLSPPDFREYQREEILAARMRDLVRARVQVSDAEAFAQFARAKSKATVDFVKFNRGFYEDVVLDTSQKAVDAWADKNKEEIEKAWASQKSRYLPECRVTRHILAKIDPQSIDPDAAKKRAREKIEQVAERLKKGEDFADVAHEKSDDEMSARQGGSLGCVVKGKMVKPFEDATFALEAGKVSDIVESQFGFHIIKVEKIAKDAEAEKVGRAELVLEHYRRMESERMAAEGAKEVLAAVHGGKSLEDALKTYLAEIAPKKAKDDDKKADKGDKAKGDKGDKDKDKKGDDTSEKKKVTFENHPDRPRIETSLPFTADGDPITDVRPGTSVAQIAFGLEKAGDVPSDLVPLDAGYAVFQLKEKTPASKEEFEKERDMYVGEMKRKKQQDALVAYMKRLRANVTIAPNHQVVDEPKASDPAKGPPPGPEDDE
jgi:peptidyl-prolyl cis-trans isomerase D